MNNTSETSLQFHKITTRKEAEDFVYASYLRAVSYTHLTLPTNSLV